MSGLESGAPLRVRAGGADAPEPVVSALPGAHPSREEVAFDEVISRVKDGTFYQDYDWAAGPALRALDRASAILDAAEGHQVDCPRCFQQCGWCGDYRHMHGQLKLPGTSKRCTIQGMAPEVDNCPVCLGSKRVLASITYRPIPTDGDTL